MISAFDIIEGHFLAPFIPDANHIPPHHSRHNNNVAIRAETCHPSGMAKTETLGIRLEPDVRDALERAAIADDRKVSTMASKLLTKVLAEKGWLKREVPRAKRKRKA